MLQKVDCITFEAKRISVIKNAKRKRNKCMDSHIKELGDSMQKIEQQARMNAKKAWLLLKDSNRGLNAIVKK